ncbi:MAG: sulfatase-like hydrolase/transferase [Candidatus Marinimicrobia bacterium]|nr:sulfatase-like hydrolase/transferase [Candidatus Neomarinimicrobiota bacterium]
MVNTLLAETRLGQWLMIHIRGRNIPTLPTSFLQFWWGFIYLIALMNFWRLIFLLSEFQFLRPGNGWLYFSAFFVGLRLDAVIASYLMLPIAGLLMLRLFKIKEIVFKYLSFTYLVLISFTISLINIVDVFTFMEFNSHLNYLTVRSYVTQKESMAYIYAEYPVIPAVIVLVLLTGFVFTLYRKGDRAIKAKPSTVGMKAVGVLLSIILLGTSIRGGWQERPIDWGQAMFSRDFLANQIALNSMFIFGRSAIQFSSGSKAAELVSYYGADEAFQITRNLLESPETDFVDNHSMRRINRGTAMIKPNIILILLESHSGLFCGYMNGEEHSITPNLDRLAREGIAFTNCYANGKRSAHGIGSTLMSWPTLPGLPLISRVESVGKVPSLGTALKDIGYKTLFVYGGDPQFDNMKGFVKANGFDRVIERHDFSNQAEGTKWGVFDHYVFDRILKEVDEAESPIFLTMFTTTNHQPWRFPSSYETKVGSLPDTLYHSGLVHRSMSYVDHVMGEFMELASQRDWYENTIFVFIADHGLPIAKDQFENIRNANIPFVISAPGLLLEPKLIEQPVSQVDIAPTILGLINYDQSYNFFGQNALSPGTPVVCRITEDEALWLEDGYLYRERFGQKAELYKVTLPIRDEPQAIEVNSPLIPYYQEHFRAYIQTAATLFKGFRTDRD